MKIYYKIYKLFFQMVCAECKKKQPIPESDFLIDETEFDLIYNKLGTEAILLLKSGYINMKYVSGVKYLHLSEKLLEDKMKISP